MSHSNNIYQPHTVQSLFNEIAPTYAHTNLIASLGLDKFARKILLHDVKPNTAAINILDMMCGSGENWTLLKKHYPNATIHAIDLSENMIHQANIYNKQVFHNTVHTHIGNVLKNEFPNEYFDLIVCSFGIKCIARKQLSSLMQEVYRLLKPNGFYSFIEFGLPKEIIKKKFCKVVLKYIFPIVGSMLYNQRKQYQQLWQYTQSFQSFSQYLPTDIHFLSICYKTHWAGIISVAQGQK